MKRKINFILIAILIISGFLRFYNLMHDAPYFFDPDERNMAGAITQFQLPNKLTEIPNCLYSEFFSNNASQCTLNPHFFAYGQFPLYLAYISDQISRPFNHLTIKPSLNNTQPSPINNQLSTSFSSAIYWLRFWSALVSVLTVLMVYKITQLVCHPERSEGSRSGKNLPYLAALLTAFIPGLIQSAHFGTTESLLTFFFLCSIYFSLKMMSSLRRQGSMIGINIQGWIPAFAGMTKWLFLSSLSVGLAIGSKMTGVFFLVPPFLAITFILLRRTFLLGKKHYRLQLNNCLPAGKAGIIGIYWYLLVFITTAIIAVVSSPYNLVEPNNFLSAVFGYERDVAMGKYEAFYTRQFVHTTPIIFQFEKIFPYSLGIILTVLGSLGFLVLIFILFKSLVSSLRKQGSMMRNLTQRWIPAYAGMTIMTVSFLIYLIPNALLFAKWSRFMTPVLPFFVIFTTYGASVILVRMTKQFNKKIGLLAYWIIGLLVLISLLQGLSFFSIYTREDSRFAASRWIYKNIPSNSYVLSETANVIDIPIPPPSPAEASAKEGNLQPTTHNLQSISFDFYHLDENPELQTQLISYLQKADYIFVPSRRIFANYTRESGKYPILNRYYRNLFNGNLGFESVAEISSFPSLCFLTPNPCLLSFPDESAEETFTVFDHPVIRIYKKNQSKTSTEYRKLLISS